MEHRRRGNTTGLFVTIQKGGLDIYLRRGESDQEDLARQILDQSVWYRRRRHQRPGQSHFGGNLLYVFVAKDFFGKLSLNCFFIAKLLLYLR